MNLIDYVSSLFSVDSYNILHHDIFRPATVKNEQILVCSFSLSSQMVLGSNMLVH